MKMIPAPVKMAVTMQVILSFIWFFLLDNLQDSFVMAIVTAMLVIELLRQLVLSWFILKGYNWARICEAGLFFIFLLEQPEIVRQLAGFQPAWDLNSLIFPFFGNAIAVALMFTPKSNKWFRAQEDERTKTEKCKAGQKSRPVALCMAFVLGWFGLHRFYLGKRVSAFLILSFSLIGTLAVTTAFSILPELNVERLGDLSLPRIVTALILILCYVLALIWPMLDFILILCGFMKDKNGQQLVWRLN